MIIYQASELGGCSKYLIHKRFGYDPIPGFGDDVQAFQRGHDNEAEVLEYVQEKLHWRIESQQNEFLLALPRLTEDGESVAISCHPDAIGYVDDARVAIEIKRANNQSYQEFKRDGWEAGGLWPRYLYQVSAYHHATKLPVVFVVRNGDLELGEQGSLNVMRLDNSPPLYNFADLYARVRDIEQRVENYDIPRECDYPNYYCPLSYLHEDQIDVLPDPDLDNLAREYVRVREEKKSVSTPYDNERGRIRYHILKHLGIDPSVDKVTRRVDTGWATIVAHYGPTSYPLPDWDKMKEDGIEVDQYKKEPKMGYRVNVFVRKGKGEKSGGRGSGSGSGE